MSIGNVCFPPDFIEAFEHKSGLEWDDAAAQCVVKLLFSTASGRVVAMRALFPHIMRYMESEMLKVDDYPEAPQVDFTGHTVTMIKHPRLERRPDIGCK